MRKFVLLLALAMLATVTVSTPAGAAARLDRPDVTSSLSRGSNIGFTWDAVPGATRYDYRIHENGAQTYRRNNVSGTAYNRAIRSTTDRVCVSVRAEASGQQASLWRWSCQDVLDAPQITQQTVADERVRIRWTAVSAATGYGLEATVDGQWFSRATVPATYLSKSFYYGTRTGRICMSVAALNANGEGGRRSYSCFDEREDKTVAPFVVVPADRQSEFAASGALGTLSDVFDNSAVDVQDAYDDLVNLTYHRQDTRVIFSDHDTEWFWCRTQDVDPAALGCQPNNFEHNLMVDLASRGYLNDKADETYLILALGGGGYAGARERRAIMGEAGWVGFRDGNCDRVLDAYPNDGTADRCRNGNWDQSASGTMAHELGHAFGLPGHAPANPNCVGVSFMDAQGCYEVDGPNLDPDEIAHLLQFFAGRI